MTHTFTASASASASASADFHPNRLRFHGTLTLVGAPSDSAPTGSRGHRVILTRRAAEAALPSLLGMGVNFNADYSGHDARQKCGVITGAELVGDRVQVEGFLYAKDFRDVVEEIRKRKGFGMSYELADAHVEDMRAEVWTITRATFTGAAILRRKLAAYRSTEFHLGAAPVQALAIAANEEALCV